MRPVPQRRKPIQRIGSRLAGFPPEADAVSTPAAPAEPPVDYTPEPGALAHAPKCPVCKTAVSVRNLQAGMQCKKWACYKCNQDFYAYAEEPQKTADALRALTQLEEKERRAKAARDRRARNAAQKKAIKEALKIPLDERLMIAQEERAANKPFMSQGMFLTDAPSRKGLLVTGGNVAEDCADANVRAGLLGPTSDPETGEEYWPVGDRRRGVPEGTGHRPGDREDDAAGDEDEKEATKDAKDNKDERGKDADILPGTKFQVKLNDGKAYQKAHEYGLLIKALVHDYFIKTDFFKDESAFCVSCGAKQKRTESIYTCIRCEVKNGQEDGYVHICRLCNASCDGSLEAEEHIERVHGSDSHPKHDSRFGNIIRRQKPKKSVTA